MKIKNVEIPSNIFLAPMAGVTDFAFRSLARNFGAGFSYTEMVSAKGLVLSKNRDVYKKMLFTLPNESPCAVQLFGSDPLFMAKACTLAEIQKFDIIDINMGCPAPKVVKNGDGSCLLLDLEKAVALAKACVEATDKPVTVKLRAGYFKDQFVAVDLAKRLESVGVSAITIHGRTKEDMYSGTVNYDIIKAVKQAVNIPVIGNGDIVDHESYNKMLETGVDAVMIGRGALGAPWIFKEILGQTVTDKEKFMAIKQHISLLKNIYDEKFLTTYLRKHFLWYVKGKSGIAQKKVWLAKTTNLEDALEILKEVFNA